MLRGIAVLLFLTVYVLLLGPPFILHCLVTGRVGPLYFIGVSAARIALRIGGIRVRAEGLENIPCGVCIFVANHTSNADPPAVVGAIPRRVALLGKKEVFRVPVFARALLLAAFVPVDRANREAALASVEKALQHLRAGVSYLIFPEGTRSPDGRLRPFKKGTFLMAIRACVPIVPVSVVGAHKVMRKGELRLRPGEVVVRFHAPVETSGFSLERKEELLTVVHRAVAAGLPDEQKPLAETREAGSFDSSAEVKASQEQEI
jgi:1-acyl-sn-glycerol-3-phosphate acyltransferase